MTIQSLWHRLKLVIKVALLVWKHGDSIQTSLKPVPVERTNQQLRELRCASLGHSKGGRVGYRASSDPCVHMHTFPDSSVKIWCSLCGWSVWNNNSTAEEWIKATSYVDSSSNIPSSSERPTIGSPTVEMRQPIHGQDEFYDKQIRLKSDDHPIKGYRKSKMNLPEPQRAIQDITTGEVFVKGEDGEAVSWGIHPLGEELPPMVVSPDVEDSK